jgi:hypothetical protein
MMKIISNMLIVCAIALSVTTPVSAQDAKDGDYYNSTQTHPQSLSPTQESRIKQGDYYVPSHVVPQQPSPAEKQLEREGDYYPPQR